MINDRGPGRGARLLPLLLAALLALSATAAVRIVNVSEWTIRARRPPVAKSLGWDSGDPAHGVKRASASWAVVDGLNVTIVEVLVPRCHRVTFSPVLRLAVGEPVWARLEAESLSGAHVSQLSVNISLEGSRQVSVRRGSLVQPTGSPVTVPAAAGFGLEVLVARDAPLGAEVARLSAWLRLNVTSARVSQRIVWVFRTFPRPPTVTIFYDGFEGGSLANWERTGYTYAEQKTYDVSVTERCYVSARPPIPSTITDTTRPISGSWLAWIGFRDQVLCEPVPELRDYLRRSVAVPASVDGVEVLYLNVTFWWRLLTWDSANYDYINISMAVGARRYFFVAGYNPNPGGNYGPFRDTGWRRNSAIFGGTAGRTVALEFLLRTYSDAYYRSWLYVDEVHITLHFDCWDSPVVLLHSTAPLWEQMAYPPSPQERQRGP